MSKIYLKSLKTNEQIKTIAHTMALTHKLWDYDPSWNDSIESPYGISKDVLDEVRTSFVSGWYELGVDTTNPEILVVVDATRKVKHLYRYRFPVDFFNRVSVSENLELI
jgi:hypothetical protein